MWLLKCYCQKFTATTVYTYYLQLKFYMIALKELEGKNRRLAAIQMKTECLTNWSRLTLINTGSILALFDFKCQLLIVIYLIDPSERMFLLGAQKESIIWSAVCIFPILIFERFKNAFFKTGNLSFKLICCHLSDIISKLK